MDFAEFRRQVDVVMYYTYLIDWNDACGDDDFLKQIYEEDQTPAQFVEWWGEKYDLDKANSDDALWGISLEQYWQRQGISKMEEALAQCPWRQK